MFQCLFQEFEENNQEIMMRILVSNHLNKYKKNQDNPQFL